LKLAKVHTAITVRIKLFEKNALRNSRHTHQIRSCPDSYIHILSLLYLSTYLSTHMHISAHSFTHSPNRRCWYQQSHEDHQP
jgi:hypothetical protein